MPSPFQFQIPVRDPEEIKENKGSTSLPECKPKKEDFCAETIIFHFQFNSVTQSCLTLCDSMDCSMPGLPVHHQLPDFTQTHVHWVCDTIQPSHPQSIVSFSSCLQSFPESGTFQMSQLFASGDETIGVSASASILPMNTQDWSPLGWTGWISLQSKGLSRVFSNTTVQKHSSLALRFLYSPILTSIHDYWKNHSLD